MAYEAWMLAAMEEYGHMDTRTGRINKVARFLVQQNLSYIGNEEFVQACYACGIDLNYFDQEDMEKIERKIYELT